MLFNHEEIGSVSTNGAESSLIPTLIERLSPTPAKHAQSIAKSFLISSDMGHAIHPNYISKHEDNHAPRMNGGIVIKTNARQRYASDAVGSFIVKQLVEKKGGKVQEYEVRNDMCVASRTIFAVIIPDRSKGLVVQLLGLSCLRAESALSTLVALCCQCTPFARLPDLTMSSTPLTFSRRSLRGSLHWIAKIC